MDKKIGVPHLGWKHMIRRLRDDGTPVLVVCEIQLVDQSVGLVSN